MSIKGLSSYTGFATWIVTMIFAMGILYSQQQSNTAEIAKAQQYKERVIQAEVDINTLKLQRDYQQEWQGEFMSTFKEMVQEIKKTNAEVLRNTYHLKSIDSLLSVK